MNRSRSGQRGSAASNFRCRVNSAVAASAMPIGIPGCPLFAASTASIARARMALARRRWVGCIQAPCGGSLGAVTPAPMLAAPLTALPVASNRALLRLPGIGKVRSERRMDGDALSLNLERAERALERIERALADREATPARDQELRAKVREVVEELDELIREAAA